MPRPRLDDVAARAGVSTATVSLVLRGRPGPSKASRTAVLRAASELGYRPDRSASLLARRRTRLLGVTLQASNTFHAEFLEDLQAAADDHGYELVVSPVTRTRDERRAVESLVDFRCEALLLLGPGLTEAELTTLAANQPVVAVGRPASAAGVDVVRAADDVGVRLAVEHLARLGHHRIAFVDGPAGPIASLRRRGFRSAVQRLARRGVPHVLAGGDTEHDGISAADALLRSGLGDQLGPGGGSRPTALVAFNDRVALGMLDRLRRASVDVPGELSVVGYDDSPVARLATIGLTSVSQLPEAMAAAAVAAASQRLDEGRVVEVDVVLDPRLVVRDTTAPPSG